MALLEVKNIHVYYGNIHALKDLSLNVDKGEIVTLIGANGAGKSTTLKTLSGILKPRSGSVQLEGDELDQVSGPSDRDQGDDPCSGRPAHIRPPDCSGKSGNGSFYRQG